MEYYIHHREAENSEMEGVNYTFYISHGSPTMAIDETMPARHFLESWKDKIFPRKPKAILVISGHWETEYPTVNVVDHNDTIHDFSNKPEKMYKLKYPAPGSPYLANKVKELLMASGFNRVDEDGQRGLDHGAWVPLMLMYPEAEIPVCQLSVSPDRDGAYHYKLGKALVPLKDEGILIFGSGSAVHNLEIDLPPETPLQSWAEEFDTWLKNALLEGRYGDVTDYEHKAPSPRKAHPTPEHFYPLHVAMGAAGENAKAKLIHHSWEHGSLSYASYQFTAVVE